MRLGFLTALFCAAQLIPAASISYTSSSAFLAAASAPAYDFRNLTNGQNISSGSTVEGLTYSAFVLTLGATQLDITNLYNSFSGLSLGANHLTQGSNQTFFYGGEGATVSFGIPITAFGIFFNVNPNSGTFGFSTSAGSASTGSASYDTSTFVFAGLTSTTPFSSITFSSTGGSAVYNVPEFLIGYTSGPEPATFGITLAGALMLAALARVRRN
ncbi:MAG TPA: hypothetical protein VNX18_06095 [Bryobacteraceae bacterium]|jgi:hypothetical protein|nr:hypothetical protein [Bryobacteraceae bacterium]